MEKIKKLKKYFWGILLISLVFLVINFSDGWIYVKVDGEVFVVNSLSSEDSEKLIKEKIGIVESTVPDLIKPLFNNTSNGFPKGTELYRSTNLDGLIVKYKDKYYELGRTSDEGWGNSIKVKIIDGEVTHN